MNAGISEGLLRECLSLVEKEVGVALKPEKLRLLKTLIGEKSRLLKTTPDNYIRHFLRQQEGELDGLASTLLNQETFFFREPGQIEAFKGLLAGVREMKRKAGDYTLKVLSAGCANGEEPYTLSIIIAESGLAPPDWDVSVTGIDINRESLMKAKAALYRENSLRPGREGAAFIKKYFTPDRDKYLLDIPWRRNVSFRAGNLLKEDTYQFLYELDFVFCRNVFIYMTDEAVRKVLGHIHGSLSAEGYFFSGSAESVREKSPLFRAERHGDALVYRKA